MNEFQQKVQEFFDDLGVAKKKTQSFLASGSKNYRKFLNQKEGIRYNYQKDVRNAVHHRGLVLLEEKVVVTTFSPDGEHLAIAQEYEDGHIDYPTEGIVEWFYHRKATIEPPLLAAYHKLFEIVGGNNDLELTFIGEKTASIVRENRDIDYMVSLYYGVEIPFEMFEKIVKHPKWQSIQLCENQ